MQFRLVALCCVLLPLHLAVKPDAAYSHWEVSGIRILGDYVGNRLGVGDLTLFDNDKKVQMQPLT